MGKTAQRLLVFFIGIPLVIALVFIKWRGQLPLNAVVVAFTAVSSLELCAMFSKRAPLPPRALIVFLSSAIPLAARVFMALGLPREYSGWALVFGILVLMGWTAFTSKSFENSAQSIALSSFILFYCGFLFSFVSRMTGGPFSVQCLSVFFLMVFACDSAAWLFGMLLGKGNRNIVAASPNKSAAGFAGGVAGSVAAAFLGGFVWPEVFARGAWRLALLGLLVSAAAITGDLVESVFKRSCGVKDSGFIMPVRGGILDSVDSLLFAAPVFYAASHFLFGVALF